MSTNRTTENKALRNSTEVKASNQQQPVGKKVARNTTGSRVQSVTTLADDAFVPQSGQPELTMQEKLREEAGMPVNNPKSQQSTSVWDAFLDNMNNAVQGYTANPDDGEHTVIVAETPKFLDGLRRDGSKKCDPFMILTLRDQQTKKEWTTSLFMADVTQMMKDVSAENQNMLMGMSPRKALGCLEYAPFRVWTLNDPYAKNPDYHIRTFFSSKQYARVYAAIQTRIEAEAKKAKKDEDDQAPFDVDEK